MTVNFWPTEGDKFSHELTVLTYQEIGKEVNKSRLDLVHYKRPLNRHLNTTFLYSLHQNAPSNRTSRRNEKVFLVRPVSSRENGSNSNTREQITKNATEEVSADETIKKTIYKEQSAQNIGSKLTQRASLKTKLISESAKSIF
jgi:hypothetical protein